MAHFDVPVDLHHAGTIAFRIARHLARLQAPEAACQPVHDILDLLAEHHEPEAWPQEEETRVIVVDCAARARVLVLELETVGVKDDRLGQSVRNLFECLGLGEEGAAQSLRVGEDPRSAMRPA